MKQYLPIIIVTLIVLAAVAYWLNTRPAPVPQPSAPGYYSGPMKGKGPTAFVAPEQLPR